MVEDMVMEGGGLRKLLELVSPLKKLELVRTVRINYFRTLGSSQILVASKVVLNLVNFVILCRTTASNRASR